MSQAERYKRLTGHLPRIGLGEAGKPCDHAYKKVGSIGRVIILYRCVKCGYEYEKDVS